MRTAAPPARAPAPEVISVVAAQSPPALEFAPPQSSLPRPASPEIQRRLAKFGAEAGDIEFSLSWNGHHDLDIYVYEPGGINWKKPRRSPMAGWTSMRTVSRKGLTASTAPAPPSNTFAGGMPVRHRRVFSISKSRSIRVLAAATAKYPTPHAKAPGIGQGHDGEITEDTKPQSYRFRCPAVPLLLAVPGEVIVDQGGVNRLPVRIARDRSTDPVEASFLARPGADGPGFGEGASPWLRIDTDDESATALVRAEAVAAPGPRELR